MFKKDVEKSTDKVIFFNDTVDGLEEIRLNWDGCVDYTIKSVVPDVEPDYIHFCSIDEMIKKLQELKRLGVENFNNEYWIK